MNRGILFGVFAFCALIALLSVLLLRRPAPEPAATSTPAAPAPSAVVPAPSVPVSPTPSRPTPRRSETATATPPATPAVPAKAAPSVALLRIDSDVPGAQVFIDRQFIGATPVTAPNVAPGTHQLNVSAEGFEGIANTIEVVPGERDIMVRFREVRLDARLAVVHKHRVGSCRGQLVATAAGLRYETSDKDDAFGAGLLDVETFEIDYLEKNLKVKLRKGKQFNFADPDGNADRLFVFHRDVDKARERLKRGDQPATQ